MKIGIDASRAVRAQKTGTEWYSYYLLKALARIDNKNSYILYTDQLPETDFINDADFQWRLIPPQKRWTQKALANEVTANPPDVLFVPSHLLPLKTKVKAVITIHDLAYKFFPSAYTLKQRFLLNYGTRKSANLAKAVITPSVQSKNDLCQIYNIDPNKVFPVAHGVDYNVFSPSTRKISPTQNPYLFAIGRLETRKNQVTLLKAYLELAKKHPKLELFMVGGEGVGAGDIKKIVSKLPTDTQLKIHLPGYLSDEEAINYLKNAAVFCYPSLYEGFGMPILEAFAARVPVVASNNSSIPEVVSHAAALVEAENVDAWVATIDRILTDSKVHDELVERGALRAKLFSWDKCAEKTLEILENVAKS